MEQPIGNYVIDLVGDRPVFADADSSDRKHRFVYNTNSDITGEYNWQDNDFTKGLYNWVQARGNRLSDVDQETLYRMFGSENDPVAGRMGNDIYVARNHGKRTLEPVERRTGIYHELGHENTDSEIEAHLSGIKFAQMFGDSEAVGEMNKQLKNLKRYYC